jgi:hypothetical protein
LEETPVDDILTSSIEQPETHQKIDVIDDSGGLLQHSPERVNSQTEQPIEVESSLMLLLHYSHPLTPIFVPGYYRDND